MCRCAFRVFTLDMIFVNFQLSQLQREIESMWNDADEEVRNTYGREYYDVLGKGLEECKPEGCLTVDPVNEAFVDAITAYNPQYRYLVKEGSGLFDVYYVSIKLKTKGTTLSRKKYHTVAKKVPHSKFFLPHCRKKNHTVGEKSTTLSGKKYHTVRKSTSLKKVPHCMKKYHTLKKVPHCLKKYHTV